MFIAALLTVVEIWKQPKCPSRDDWIKMYYIYIQCSSVSFIDVTVIGVDTIELR